MDSQRDKFSLPDDIIYLNGAYMSPMLKSVESAGIQGMRQKRNPSVLTADDFFRPVEEVKQLFDKLLHIHDPSRIVLAPSVSYALANAANNLPVFSPGSEILLVEDQFPSNYYVWKSLAEEKDYRLVVIPAPSSSFKKGEIWNRSMIDAINERTAIVAMPHVHWADGTIFDLGEVRHKLDLTGGKLIVDGTQSFGAFPFDQTEIRADVLVAATYKWLLGPYGSAIAYYSSEFDHGKPVEESWANRLHSDDFANLVNYQDSYRAGAKRYEVGQASDFIQVPMLKEAFQQLINWNPKQIEAYCRSLIGEKLRPFIDAGLAPSEKDAMSSHLFGIQIPEHIALSSLHNKLRKRGIYVSFRGQSVRISPNVYNTSEELALLLSILREEFHL
jgi:selenocysteine lyase/cysteine desulfurase